MKYKTITYQRVVNLGNYESHRLEITAEIDTSDEDILNDAIFELAVTVIDSLEKVKYPEMKDELNSEPPKEDDDKSFDKIHF